MNKKSLNSITKLFVALNDKLARIEDPILYARATNIKYQKRKNILSYFIKDETDNQKQNANDSSKNKKEIKHIDDTLANYDSLLNDHAEMINELKPIETDATKIEPIAPTEKELGAVNLRYNEKTQRFHENEGDRKNRMVSKAEASSRVEEHRAKNATPEPSEEVGSVLEEIHSNLIKINESLNSTLSLLSDKKPADSDGKVVNTNAALDAKEEKPKGGMGGLAGIIAFTLFAIFPAVLQYLKEKREKISEFLNPVFEFIFESVIPFFTEKLPKFFMEDVPEYFSEKFSVVKDFTADFIGDIKKVIAGIQKTVGETIVSLADKLPDGPFDALKDMKKGLKDFGLGLISDANATIGEVDEAQAKTQAKREEKKKRDILLKQANDEGTRVVELNKAKGYTGYTLSPNFEKGLITIEYKLKDAEGPLHVFDANKSMETGTLIEKNGGGAKPVPGDNGGTPVKDDKAQSPTPPDGGTPMPASPGAAQTGAATSNGGGPAEGGSQAEGGGATPELNPATADKGNVLGASSIANENPPAKPKSSAPPVVTMPSTGQKVRMLPGSGPHDINDVPDPTPFFADYMANQLFYRSA